MAEGKLIVNAKKQIRVKFTNIKGKGVELAVPDAELARRLKEEPVEKLHGRQVELDEEKGQPKRVRPIGEPFAAVPAQVPARPIPQHRGQPRRTPQGQPRSEERRPTVQGDFHNPYNFVPALPRDRVAGELGDHEPLGHHVLQMEHYTGVMRVKMTVKTPLLLPDAARATEVANDHRSFPVRVDADGNPYLPPTSIKGMLRSAYEAVTNSRLGGFVGHDAKLQFRKWNPETKSAPKIDHPVAPGDLLPESLKPAYWIDKLSPADRVFGWVRQCDPQREKTRTDVAEQIRAVQAYRGNVRIGPVTCKQNAAIENFASPGLPLAILGQPKPQQARFYVAKNPHGDAQDPGLPKGYSRGKGLRGRKVYPHHRGLPDGHWEQPLTDRTQRASNGHFQEYRRPQLNHQEQRDNQNRSIQGWVKPGTVFTFDLHVTNHSEVELGALLWLLSLPDDHVHRLGGGKPLGFGSVRLEIESAHLDKGCGWKHVYSTLDDSPAPDTGRAALVEGFKRAVQTAYGPSKAFEQVPFIAAWLRMATGHPAPQGRPGPLPTHYPRFSVQPDPAGENFRWFTANESGQRVGLSDLATDAGLPLYDGQ